MNKIIRLIPFGFVILLLGLTGAAVHTPVLAQSGVEGSTLYLPLIFKDEPPLRMGPDGGSVVSLATAPTNPNIVYASTLGGGVFRSDNGGLNWKSTSNGLTELWSDVITVDPKNANIVYAGTHGSGVFKSTDGGQSWFPATGGMSANMVIYALAVNPGNTNLVYAGGRVSGTTYHGLMYKSTNGGASWSVVMEYSDDWVYSIAVNPSSPNVVIAAVHTRGPRVSYDYGSRNTWNDANPPAIDSYSAGRWLKGRSVAYDPRNGSQRAYYTAWQDGFVTVSQDQGIDWSNPPENLGTSHIYPNGISVKPDAPDVVYLAAHESNLAGVIRSSNAGRSWYGAGLYGKTVYSVAALGGGGDTLLAGTYINGIYRSTNGGGSWVHSISGLISSQVTGMVFTSGNTIYGSTIGNGIFKSTDGGVTWSEFNNNLGDMNVLGLIQHPSHPNILFALTNNAGLRKIDLNAASVWGVAAADIKPGGSVALEEQYRFLPPDAANDMLEEDLAPHLPGQLDAQMAITQISAPATAMTFAPSNANVAYVGTNGSGVYVSKDGANSWDKFGGLSGAVRSIAVDPSNPAVIYVATNSAGVIRTSQNYGSTWADLKLPESSADINCVAVWPGDAQSVYVGTNKGLYRYKNGSWTKVAFNGMTVTALAYNPSVSGRLYAGLLNAGGYVSYDGANWGLLRNEFQESVQSINF